MLRCTGATRFSATAQGSIDYGVRGTTYTQRRDKSTQYVSYGVPLNDMSYGPIINYDGQKNQTKSSTPHVQF